MAEAERIERAGLVAGGDHAVDVDDGIAVAALAYEDPAPDVAGGHDIAQRHVQVPGFLFADLERPVGPVAVLPGPDVRRHDYHVAAAAEVVVFFDIDPFLAVPARCHAGEVDPQVEWGVGILQARSGRREYCQFGVTIRLLRGSWQGRRACRKLTFP